MLMLVVLIAMFFAEAIRYVLEGLYHAPHRCDLYYWLATIANTRQEHQNAIGNMWEALRCASDSPHGPWYAGGVYRDIFDPLPAFDEVTIPRNGTYRSEWHPTSENSIITDTYNHTQELLANGWKNDHKPLSVAAYTSDALVSRIMSDMNTRRSELVQKIADDKGISTEDALKHVAQLVDPSAEAQEKIKALQAEALERAEKRAARKAERKAAGVDENEEDEQDEEDAEKDQEAQETMQELLSNQKQRAALDVTKLSSAERELLTLQVRSSEQIGDVLRMLQRAKYLRENEDVEGLLRKQEEENLLAASELDPAEVDYELREQISAMRSLNRDVMDMTEEEAAEKAEQEKEETADLAKKSSPKQQGAGDIVQQFLGGMNIVELAKRQYMSAAQLLIAMGDVPAASRLLTKVSKVNAVSE